MMRLMSLFSACILATFIAQAQAPDSSVVADLRALAREIRFEHDAHVRQLIDWNDSLRIDKKKWQPRYDSLFNDTLAMNEVERNFVRLDGAMLAFVQEPSDKTYGVLKNAFTSVESKTAEASAYNRELNAVLLEIAVGQNDFSFAYALQNKLNAFRYADWEAAERILKASMDSVSTVLKNEMSSHASNVNALNTQLMQWHIAAVLAIALLVILAGVLLWLKRRWKIQRARLTVKAEDTSEEEALVHKLEQARREIQELKLLAKKTIEAPPVVPAPVPVEAPVHAGLTAAEISDWNNQVQQALVKIKSHCEAGKNAMSVPTYMSIVNDVTRLSNQVGKKSEEWMAVVSGK